MFNFEDVVKKSNGRYARERDFDRATLDTEEYVLLAHKATGLPMSGTPHSMDESGNLIFEFKNGIGVMPFDNVDMYERFDEHNVITVSRNRVGRPTCFEVVGEGVYDGTTVTAGEQGNGRACLILGRASVQEAYYNAYLSKKAVGDVITCRVTGFSHSAAYCDIGCGVTAMLPVTNMSVNRLQLPSDRVHALQTIHAVIKSIDTRGRFILSMRELLGTWQENADMYTEGLTTVGVVRDIMDYGAFIELTPNLAGLAEISEEHPVFYGDVVIVRVEMIFPEKMKIKLSILGKAVDTELPVKFRYFIPESRHLNEWHYSTPDSPKQISSVFCAEENS